ncbi:MAG: hypothetical protein CM1200mP3_05120 [Chloroflexota bacterium]|nr:MAG: hypothetical protein CM1200mP3_05120 [Chloroflexota bacterium]
MLVEEAGGVVTDRSGTRAGPFLGWNYCGFFSNPSGFYGFNKKQDGESPPLAGLIRWKVRCSGVNSYEGFQ